MEEKKLANYLVVSLKVRAVDKCIIGSAGSAGKVTNSSSIKVNVAKCHVEWPRPLSTSYHIVSSRVPSTLVRVLKLPAFLLR